MKVVRVGGLILAALWAVLMLLPVSSSSAAEKHNNQRPQGQASPSSVLPQPGAKAGQPSIPPVKVQQATPSSAVAGSSGGCQNAAGSIGKPVKLTVKDALAVVGGDAEFRAILTTADGTPISGVPLVFVLNGKELGRNTTTADGGASRKHRITPDVKMEGNIVEVRFDGKPGSAEFNCASQTARLAIIRAVTNLQIGLDFDKKDMKMFAPGIPAPENKRLYFRGRLTYKTEDGLKPLAGKTIGLKLGTITGNSVTDVDGTVAFEIVRDPSNIGKSFITEKLEYSFAGDTRFQGFSQTMDINYYPANTNPGAPPPFKARTSIVNGYPFMLIAGKTTKIMAALWYGDDETKPVANQKVRIFAFKKDPLGPYAIEAPFQMLLGEGTTDAAGRITVSYMYEGKTNINNYTEFADEGSYVVAPAILHNGKYWTAYSTYPATLIISKTFLDFHVQAPEKVKAGEKLVVRVRALRKYDKHPVEGIRLSMAAPPHNERTHAGTDKDGYANFSLPTAAMGSGKKKFAVGVDSSVLNESDVYSGGTEFFVDILPAQDLWPVDIDVYASTVAFGGQASIKAKAKAIKGPLKGVKLYFAVYESGKTPKDAVKYDEAVTGADGIAEAIIPVTISPGTYGVQVKYEGQNAENGFKPATGKGILRIDKAYYPITAKYDENVSSFMRLVVKIDTWFGALQKTEPAEPPSTVTVKIGDKTYPDMDITDGDVVFDDKLVAEGMQVIVDFKGNKNLVASRYTGVIQGGKIVGSSSQVGN